MQRIRNLFQRSNSNASDYSSITTEGMGIRSWALWQKILFYSTIAIFVILLILFLAIWVVFPLIFMNTISIQRFFMFFNTDDPKNPEYNNPEKYDMDGVVNFYITTKDTDNFSLVSIGAWMILHEDDINSTSIRGHTVEDVTRILSETKRPIVIYMHGVACNRILPIATYKVARKHFLVISLDHRDTICKEKWKALRDAFHRSIKRHKSKSGDGAKKMKKWRFESQMEFLLLYFQERLSKTNITDAMISDDDDQMSDLSATSPSSVPVNSPRPSSRSTFTPDLAPVDSPRPSSRSTLTHDLERPGSSSKTTPKIFENMTARKKNKQPQSQVANVLQKYLGSKRVSISPIHSFFKAMADAVVDLSPNLQLKVKNEVYSIVSQAESENMTRTPTSSVSTGSITPNRDIDISQQKKPTTIVLLNENGTNDETQYILQPSQSVLQPQSQARYRYYINPNGEISYENEINDKNSKQ